MRLHSWLLLLTALLIVPGALGAGELVPTMPGAADIAPQLNGKIVVPSGPSFGFSPFMEEGLVAEVPGLGSRKALRNASPAYLREFGATSD